MSWSPKTCFSLQRISQRAVQISIAIGPIASQELSTPVFLRKRIQNVAICDYPGGFWPPVPSSGSAHGEDKYFQRKKKQTNTMKRTIPRIVKKNQFCFLSRKTYLIFILFCQTKYLIFNIVMKFIFWFLPMFRLQQITHKLNKA